MFDVLPRLLFFRGEIYANMCVLWQCWRSVVNCVWHGNTRTIRWTRITSSWLCNWIVSTIAIFFRSGAICQMEGSSDALLVPTGRQTEHFDGNLPELMSSLWEKLCIVGGGGYARVVDRFSIQLSVNYCRYRNHRQTHVWRGMWHSRYGCHLFCCCTPTLPLVLRYIWMAGHFGKSPIGCPDQ